MADKKTAKQWFKTGMIPTQDQFWSFFDSIRWNDEKVPIISIQGLDDAFQEKADAEALTNHLGDLDAHEDLFSAKQDKLTPGDGLEINDQNVISASIPISSKFTLVHKVTDSRNPKIEIGDYAKGFGPGTGEELEFWTLAIFQNLTGDENTNNYLNYKRVSGYLPNS